jgi:hypothetical protein
LRCHLRWLTARVSDCAQVLRKGLAPVGHETVKQEKDPWFSSG